MILEHSLTGWYLRMRFTDAEMTQTRFALVDVNANGVADVRPFLDEPAVLGEHLNAIVRSIGHETRRSPVDRDPVHQVKLSRALCPEPPTPSWTRPSRCTG